MRALMPPGFLVMGLLAPWFSPFQPNWYWLPVPLALLAIPRTDIRVASLMLALGLGISLQSVDKLLKHQVPDVPGGVDIRITGKITSEPRVDGEVTRFDLQVFDAVAVNETQPSGINQYAPRKLRVSWYQDAPELSRGQFLEAELRVRAPRGLMNPGLFDYRSWLVSRGYDGTAYVRQPLLLGAVPLVDPFTHWRQRSLDWILTAEGLQHTDLLAALSLGEQSAMTDARWRQLEQFGLIHLMVISGLHIGFAATMGYLAFSPLTRLGSLFGLPGTSRDWAALGGLLVATLYAASAGFTLPTRRALGAVFLWYLTGWLRRRTDPAWGFLSLMALLLLIQPLAAIQVSLWLSFGAVLVLILALRGRQENRFAQLIRAQIAMLTVFSGILLFLGKPLYPLGVICNLIAVPLTGLCLVPLLLLGLACHQLASSLADHCLGLVDWMLDLMFAFFNLLMPDRAPSLLPQLDSALYLLVAVQGLLFLWLRVPTLGLGWLICWIALLFPPARDSSGLTLRVFDVGQGTAILIQQQGYQFLYDAGPSYPSGFNAGADILLPWFSSHGIQLDALMISHDDRDHVGGYQPIAEKGEIPLQWAGPGVDLAGSARTCEEGQQWQWLQANYRLLSPRSSAAAQTKDNDLSCVLLIEWRDLRILLAGDIEAEVEAGLLNQLDQPVDWLLVPHHGSRTSSTGAFVKRLAPSYAVITAGWGNSYGHPVDDVLQRYESQGSQLESTAASGMLSFHWDGQGVVPEIVRAAQTAPFWWMRTRAELLCLASNGCGRRRD